MGEIDEMFGYLYGIEPNPDRPRRLNQELWSPCIEAFWLGEHWIVKVKLPGIDRKDIYLTLSNGQLTISGFRKVNTEGFGSQPEGQPNHRYNTFQRVVELPAHLDEDGAKASFYDGVLEVSFTRCTATDEVRELPIEESKEQRQGWKHS